MTRDFGSAKNRLLPQTKTSSEGIGKTASKAFRQFFLIDTGIGSAYDIRMCFSFLLLISVGAFASSPSFDCQIKTAPEEKLVCGDSLLSQYDQDIARLYEITKTKRGFAKVKEAQRNWMRKRAACLKPAVKNGRDCLVNLYASRLKELNRVASGDNPKKQLISSGYQRDGFLVLVTDRPISGADPESFSVISNWWYAKDKSHVYHRENILPKANPSSFRLLSPNHGTDGEHVYIEGEYQEHIDAKSFVAFDLLMSKDAKHVYHQKAIIPTADPATFSTVGPCHYKDAGHVFYFYTLIPDADPMTFKVLDQACSFAIDSKRAYYEGKAIPGTDPKTFKVVDQRFSKDSRNTYYKAEVAKTVSMDEKTLQLVATLESGPDPWCAPVTYSKDKSKVFFEGGCGSHDQQPGPSVIEGADPKTFVVLSSEAITIDGYAKDDHHVFYGGAELIGADPASFEEMPPFAKDAKNVYCRGVRIAADPKSFRRLDIPVPGTTIRTLSSKFYFYGKDSKHVFYEDKIVEGADPKTFTGHEWVPVDGNDLGDEVVDAADNRHEYSRGQAVK